MRASLISTEPSRRRRWLLLVACVPTLLAWSAGLAGAQALEDYDYEDLSFRGIGLEIGYVLPRTIEPTVSFGLRGDMGYVGPHVRVVPSIRYWSSHLKDGQVERLADQFIELCNRNSPDECPEELDLGEIRRSDLELAGDIHVMADVLEPLVPYGGGGVSLHLLNGSGEAIADTFVEDLLDTVAPGLNLLGGVMARMGSNVQLNLEARLVLTSDVQYGNLVLGAVWTLPVPQRQ